MIIYKEVLLNDFTIPDDMSLIQINNDPWRCLSSTTWWLCSPPMRQGCSIFSRSAQTILIRKFTTWQNNEWESTIHIVVKTWWDRKDVSGVPSTHYNGKCKCQEGRWRRRRGLLGRTHCVTLNPTDLILIKKFNNDPWCCL
jgi:hypothetical protein